VFSHTPTANTTFAFTNPAASGTSSSATLKLTGANVTNNYDIANASYDSKSLSVNAQDSVPQGLAFKSDGTKMYMLGQAGDDVNEYNLSTAWDISTGSYSQNFSVAAQDGAPGDIFFKDDGLKMYVVGYVNDNVYEYNLSTAWDISTASYSQAFSISTQSGVGRALFFKNDGTKMYVGDASNLSVYEYGLSTAWNISTSSYTQNFSVSTQVSASGLHGLFFKPDGTKMFVCDVAGDVYEYSLSTGWDLSTASYSNNTFDSSSQATQPSGISFKTDGSKMYLVGVSTDTIFQYSTSSTALATITYPASVIWSGGTTPTAPANGETDVYSFYTDDGGTTYYGFVSGDALA
jgi:sugar lactone lactonase YvrE